MGTVKTFIGNIKGKPGEDPYVGTNGNWWVGNLDTGVKAEGMDGKSAYEYAKEGGFTGTEEEFASKLNETAMDAYTKAEADARFLTEESDPTVPEWAKAAEKPTYTASEVGADASGSAAAALTEANDYTDEKIALLLNNSSEAVDSIMELATAMEENADVVQALNEAIGKKAAASDLTSHKGTTGTSSNYGHVKLSDTATTDNASSGVAATPYLVHNVFVTAKAAESAAVEAAAEAERAQVAADNASAKATAAYNVTKNIKTESWTFTLEDGSTVTKAVCVQ